MANKVSVLNCKAHGTKILKNFAFVILIALLATSCTSISPKFGHLTGYLDYSQFAEEGFFITESKDCPVDYKPIGSMSVTEYSGSVESEDQATPIPIKTFEDDLYGTIQVKENRKPWRFATSESALKTIVDRAKEVGANGIIGLEIKPVVDPKTYIAISVTVSGMLIKR